MNFFLLIPVFLGVLLLGAHFLRAGDTLLVVVTLAIPFVLLIRRPVAVRIVQGELIIGGLEWIRTCIDLVTQRQSMGMPWGRLSVILGLVALLTVCSAFVFRFSSLRTRYNI